MMSLPDKLYFDEALRVGWIGESKSTAVGVEYIRADLAQTWVSVDDALPEVGQVYLLCVFYHYDLDTPHLSLENDPLVAKYSRDFEGHVNVVWQPVTLPPPPATTPKNAVVPETDDRRDHATTNDDGAVGGCDHANGETVWDTQKEEWLFICSDCGWDDSGLRRGDNRDAA